MQKFSEASHGRGPRSIGREVVLKKCSFRKFFPYDPVNGRGLAEGAEVVMSDYQASALAAATIRRTRWEDVVTVEDVDPSLMYCGAEIEPGDRVAFYYPAGIGDAACHTAVVSAIRQKQPKCAITVFTNEAAAPVWFLNPTIDLSCARNAFPTWAELNAHDHWFFGDAVVYNLVDAKQPNIYDVLSGHFGIQIENRRPSIFVSIEEAARLYRKLEAILGKDISEDAICLFAPMSTKPNRNLPAERWIPIVEALRAEGHQVLAIGGQSDIVPLSILSKTCAVLAGALSVREMIVLAHEASSIVSVDSALTHIGAAFNIPTVAAFGPFAPRMRSSTYPVVSPIWPSEKCERCPCCWHDDKFPEGCPSAAGGKCRVMDAVTPEAVMSSLERAVKSLVKIK